MRILLAILLLSVTGALGQTASIAERKSPQLRTTGTNGNRVDTATITLTPSQAQEVFVYVEIKGAGASAFGDGSGTIYTFVRFAPGQTRRKLILLENGTGADSGNITVRLLDGDDYDLGTRTVVTPPWERTEDTTEEASPSPPTITLATPADSATDDSEWALPFTSSFTASGEHRVESITYQVFDSGGSLVSETAADMGAVGYAASYTLGTPGSYTVRAALHYDDEDSAPQVVYSTSNAITVTDPSITVTIDSPSDSDTLTVDVADTVEVTATPASGTITQVQLFEDGVLVDTDSASPWVLDYTPTVLGSHTLTVTATRSLGGTESDSITITCIPAANASPTIELAMGSSDLELPGLSIAMSATASDVDGTIANVKFYRNGSLYYTDTSAPYGTTDVTDRDPGRYVFTAVAEDNSGATTTSNQVIVDVIEDQTPYALTGPGNATVEVGQSITLTASQANPTGSETYQWATVSAPSGGTATYGTATAISTSASFDTAGTWVVSITATSGGIQYTRQATITVASPPYLFTGPADLTLAVNEVGTFTATQANGSASSIVWTKTSGPGSLIFGSTGISTTVYSATAGSYVVTVTATYNGTPYVRTCNLTITPTDTSPTPQDPPAPDEVNSITLPVMVYDHDDQTDGSAAETVTVKLNSDYTQTSGTVLEFTTFNLAHGNSLSVRFNGGTPILVRDSTVTVMENALNNHGTANGYLGDFPVKRMELVIPNGSLVAGANTITFRFIAPWASDWSGTGVTYDNSHFASAGYRVLYFNIKEPSGTRLLDSSDFSVTDYSAFTAPAGSSVATGQSLWNDDTKLTSSPGNQQPKLTSCADCHSTGNILAYLRMENDAIIARSRFHGLTEAQGKDIAAYIRSLTPAQTSTNAFPWSLPFQPGPNLATLDNAHWAAGEMKSHSVVPDLRIPDVLENAAEHITEIYGASIDNADLHYSTSQDAEWSTRIHFQTLSYPQWVPDIHPKEFLNSRSSWNNSQLKHRLDQMAAAPTNFSTWEQVSAESYTFIKSSLMTPFADSSGYFTDDAALYPYSVKKIAALMALDFEVRLDLSGTDRHGSDDWDNTREYMVRSLAFNASPLQSRVKTSSSNATFSYAMGDRSVASKRFFDVNWYQQQVWTDPYFVGDNRNLDSGRSYHYGAISAWRRNIPGFSANESLYPLTAQFHNVLMRYCQRDNNVNNRFGGKYLPHFNPQVMSDVQHFASDDLSDASKRQILLASIENFLDFVDQISVATWQTSTVVSGTTSGVSHVGTRDDHNQLQIWYELLWNLKNRCGVSTSNSTYVRLLAKAQAIWPSQATWP